LAASVRAPTRSIQPLTGEPAVRAGSAAQSGVELLDELRTGRRSRPELHEPDPSVPL
jgi:hypothetical protein